MLSDQSAYKAMGTGRSPLVGLSALEVAEASAHLSTALPGKV